MKIIARPANNAPGQDGANTQPGQADQGRPRSTTSAAADRMRPKKLPCGHILHFSCLRSWLERQQICPTCRRPVLPTRPRTDGAAAAPGGGGGIVQGFQDGLAAGRQNRERQNGQGNNNAREGGNGYRGRVFQIGPLRIGVGAGRGNLYDDLVQRLHDEEPAPARDQDANNANRPQQYGLGFGFGRPRHSDRRRYPTSGNLVADALELAEQRLAQEIEDLRVASSELNVVRMLQAEMNRLRAQRQANATAATSQPTTEAALPRPTPTAANATATGFIADSRQNVLQSGSEALPQGLTLPEGWSMMPLQRMQPGTQLPQIAVAQPGMGNFGMPAQGFPVGQGFAFGGFQGQQPLMPFGGGYGALNNFGPQAAPIPPTNVPQTATAAPTPQPPVIPVAQEEAAANQSNPTADAATENIDQDVLDMFRENARLHEEILRTHHGMSDEEIAEHTHHHHDHFHSTEDDETPNSPQTGSISVTSPSLPAASAASPDVHVNSPAPAYLPMWGSGTVPTPTTNGDTSHHSHMETQQEFPVTNAESSSSAALPNGEDNSSNGEELQSTQSASAGRAKEPRKPTVEDSLEGPD